MNSIYHKFSFDLFSHFDLLITIENPLYFRFDCTQRSVCRTDQFAVQTYNASSYQCTVRVQSRLRLYTRQRFRESHITRYNLVLCLARAIFIPNIITIGRYYLENRKTMVINNKHTKKA